VKGVGSFSIRSDNTYFARKGGLKFIFEHQQEKRRREKGREEREKERKGMED